MSSQLEETMRHPLQRINSPGRASALLHIAGLVSFAASYRYLVDFPTPVNDSYGWHWQYLTIIGLTLATASFAFGLLADLTSGSLSSNLFATKNTLSLCSAPLEVLISILYWGISAIDRVRVIVFIFSAVILMEIRLWSYPLILH